MGLPFSLPSCCWLDITRGACWVGLRPCSRLGLCRVRASLTLLFQAVSGLQLAVCRVFLQGFLWTFHFILSYFNTKTLSAKKENKKTIAIQINIYLHIKSYKFAGLPRDRASGRMLVFRNSFTSLLKVVIVELILITNGISFHVFAPE